MRLGGVERVEVVLDRVDLAAVEDLVAHPDEDVLDPAPGLRDQVVRAAGDLDTRQGRVERRVAHGTRELRPARLHGRLDPLAERVQSHPALAVADLTERELQRALAAEVADARVVELGVVRGARDRGERLTFERLDVHGGDCTRFVHGSSSRSTVRKNAPAREFVERPR